jgi:hypothetical protein
MHTFRIAYPLYCFNESCHQSVYSQSRKIVTPRGEALPAMKHYCPLCNYELLSALDIELENMAIGGGLTFSADIAVSENGKK